MEMLVITISCRRGQCILLRRCRTQ